MIPTLKANMTKAGFFEEEKKNENVLPLERREIKKFAGSLEELKAKFPDAYGYRCDGQTATLYYLVK